MLPPYNSTPCKRDSLRQILEPVIALAGDRLDKELARRARSDSSSNIKEEDYHSDRPLSSEQCGEPLETPVGHIYQIYKEPRRSRDPCGSTERETEYKIQGVGSRRSIIDGRKTCSLQQAHLSYQDLSSTLPNRVVGIDRQLGYPSEPPVSYIEGQQPTSTGEVFYRYRHRTSELPHTHQSIISVVPRRLPWASHSHYRYTTEAIDSLQSIGLLIYRSIDLPIYRSTNLPIYRSTDLPIYQSTNLPIYQSTNLPIYRSINHLYQWSLGDLTLGYIITSEVVCRAKRHQRQSRSLSTIHCSATDGATDRLQYTYQ
eukprot:scaffold299_cov256-Amphora_coffeaeformis.AAC.2